MTRQDTIQDLATLTTIPYNTLQKLIDIMCNVIAYDVQEAIKNKDTKLVVDIGIGTLNLMIVNDELSYKFIPSSKLECEIVNSINGNTPGLVVNIEDSIRKKVMNTYKELF